MQTSTCAHNQLFEAASQRNLLIMPAIESANATFPLGGRSESFHFSSDFPGTQANPSPGLVTQIVDLVNRSLLNPAHLEWAGA